ncbi:hypothetical protein L0337_44255 [candidate division KSB1 bacterium]|nr:hypothetical protein [candidate division KSB1 bacterium]
MAIKTKLLIAFTFIIGFFFNASPANSVDEDGVIKIHLSYKIILNPKNLARPNPYSQPGESVTDAMIEEAVAEMNALLASYWRGYRFEVDEILEIGALGGFAPDPGHWFDVDFVEVDKKHELINEMITTLINHPQPYAWRENAINIYINQATSGAKWRIKKFKDVIVMGADSVSAGWLLLHEIGHYFDLRHTHGDLGIALPNQILGQKIPGDDKVDDTINDLANWDRDDIAAYNFTGKYDQLQPRQKKQVDDVAENIMSYHFLKPIKAIPKCLTEGQLDRWADTTLDFYRQQVRDGRTWFVDRQTPGHEGTSTYPFDSVNLAIAAANSNGGDIILLRPGAFNEAVTISKPVTIRATRKGPASIGTSIMLAEISTE